MSNIQKFILFTIIVLLNVNLKSQANTNSLTQKQEILSIFSKAIKLNEDFKASIHKVSFEMSSKKRKRLEIFHEDTLRPYIKRCIEILSNQNDTQLIKKYCDLLISYDNSADEYFSYSMGRIFYFNPYPMLDEINLRDKSKQKILIIRIENGLNYISNDKDISLKIVEKRKTLLRKMKN